jgi:hypothetical protein
MPVSIWKSIRPLEPDRTRTWLGFRLPILCGGLTRTA